MLHSDDPQVAAEIAAWFLSRLVARHYLYVDEHRPIVIDTSELTKYLWETAVRQQDGTVDIVAQYGQLETAKDGHMVVIRSIIDKLRDTDKSVLAVVPDIANVVVNADGAAEMQDRINALLDDAQHKRGGKKDGET